MARNRITGRETQKMQEYTQEQINQAEQHLNSSGNSGTDGNTQHSAAKAVHQVGQLIMLTHGHCVISAARLAPALTTPIG